MMHVNVHDNVLLSINNTTIDELKNYPKKVSFRQTKSLFFFFLGFADPKQAY